MGRRKPSYPQDTNASSGSTSVEPVKLSGNVGFPDPLLLLRQATANSGAVSANGVQAAGSYDLTASGTAVPTPAAGDSRHGFDYSAFMHLYNGANVADLQSTGALTFMIRHRPRASGVNGVILRFGGESGAAKPAGNIHYQLDRLPSGEYRFVQQSGSLATDSHTFDMSILNGAEKHTIGIRRQSDGVTVELIVNGVPYGSPVTLSAPPDGGTSSFLHIGALALTSGGGGATALALTSMSGIYLVKSALTDAQLLALHNSMMV